VEEGTVTAADDGDVRARRPQAGRTTLNPSTFDLPLLLKDLEMMFRVRTDEKKLSFSVETIGDVPQYIVTDINKLRQVFISVARQRRQVYRTGRHRRARARGPRGRDGTVSPGRNRGHGPGISPDDQAKLFRHFEQTKTAGNRRGPVRDWAWPSPGVRSPNGRSHHGKQPGW